MIEMIEQKFVNIRHELSLDQFIAMDIFYFIWYKYVDRWEVRVQDYKNSSD